MFDKIKILGSSIIIIILIAVDISAQDISEHLIVNDIGDFRASKNPTEGHGPGILAATGHFYLDHQDITYEIDYFNLTTRVGPDVQVTQHSGEDSDQWLLHEVEDSFRSGKDIKMGQVIERARIRDIINNRIIFHAGSTITYAWISNNTSIYIEYSNLSGPKPEPLEVVEAYLQKYPSTLTSTYVLDQSLDEQWIKDEISRRLWLCDKWFSWQAGGNAEMPEALKNVVKHMGYFLDYRQRYFSMSADQDRIDLTAAQRNNDDTAIMAKLTEYKQWWDGHKGDSISLP